MAAARNLACSARLEAVSTACFSEGSPTIRRRSLASSTKQPGYGSETEEVLDGQHVSTFTIASRPTALAATRDQRGRDGRGVGTDRAACRAIRHQCDDDPP